MKRTRLRRRGKGAAKWESTRQEYLAALHAAAGGGEGGQLIPCMARSCRTPLAIVWDGRWKTTGDIHHVIARSRAPRLVHSWGNLRHICATCHKAFEFDKGGEKWRAQE